MSKQHNKKHKWDRYTILWVVSGVLWAVAIGMLVFRLWKPAEPVRRPAQTTAPTAAQPQTDPETELTSPAETEPVPTEPRGMDLGSGIYVEELLSYSGAFREDRTDEQVEDVLAIRVTNTGGKYIQTMDVVLSDGVTEARFSLSTLFPGETVIVPELNRMAFASAPDFTEAAAEAVALFEEAPGMCEDLVQIQCLSGVMNITNISGADISDDILVYYKNYEDGVYYGGITYRVRISGGMKDGEIRQGSAAHFDPENSRVVFVTCGG